MRIAIVGLGYVGAVTTACLADLGREVIGVDLNTAKADAVRRGRSPVAEPGLDELLTEGLLWGTFALAKSLWRSSSPMCS